MKRQWLVMGLGLGLAACEGDDTADNTADSAAISDAGVVDATAESEGSQLVAEQIACEFENFQPPALAGPGLGQPVDGPFIASATALYLLPGAESRQRFGRVIGPVLGDLNANPGLLAQAVTYDERCGVARTFTLWRDRASMYAFVGGDAHVAAVEALTGMGRPESVVTHWEVAPDGFPPTWDDTLEKTSQGRQVGP